MASFGGPQLHRRHRWFASPSHLALAASAAAFSSPAVATRSNIVVLLTDDQDLRLGSMLAMPFAQRNLVEAGATHDCPMHE